ncbi:general stress protein [Oceanobacillus caeni]|nr:general stress protein [Oceanobacillus caeni]
MEQVKLVENDVQAKEAIEQFLNQGFTRDEVYLLAHSKDHSENLTNAMNTNDIGVAEQGIVNSIANVFRSRGDELRSKMESLGLSNLEAQ